MSEDTWYVYEHKDENVTGVYMMEDFYELAKKHVGGVVTSFKTIEEAFAHLEKKRNVIVLSDEDDDENVDDEGPTVIPHSKLRRVETPPNFEAFTFSKNKPVVRQKTLSLSTTTKPPDEAFEGLDPDQTNVVQHVIRGESLFFTGRAGSGKSFLISRIGDILKKKYGKDRVAITASTGSAAVNIGGTTIHSWMGIGLGKGTCESLGKQVQATPKARDRIKRCFTLILDEIGTVKKELFDKFEYVCRYVRSIKKDAASVASAPWFGGIQVILVGDFLQLPPVVTNEDTDSGMYAFVSEAWKIGIKYTLVLRNHHRQVDPTFVQLLDDARHGVLSDDSRTILRQCVNRPLEFPVHLYSRRNDASERNKRELDAIDSPLKIYKADDCYDSLLHQSRVESLKKNWQVDEEVVLKKGARVLLLRNMDLERGLCNGSQGVIVDFKADKGGGRQFPEVLFRNGQQRLIAPETFTVEEFGMPIAVRVQVPLTLAYALTIHKSQGMTLDAAICDISNTFANGQAYVAMSRTRTLEGLSLKSVPLTIHADPSAVEFHRSIGD